MNEVRDALLNMACLVSLLGETLCYWKGSDWCLNMQRVTGVGRDSAIQEINVLEPNRA